MSIVADSTVASEEDLVTLLELCDGNMKSILQRGVSKGVMSDWVCLLRSVLFIE